MDTLEFLKRVLPIEGFYVTTVINKDGRRQGFFDSVEELAQVCERLDSTGNNTYFAISSFLQKGNRKQDNVKATKVVAIDVDCGEGKPYTSSALLSIILRKQRYDTSISIHKKRLQKISLANNIDGLLASYLISDFLQ